MKKRGVVLGFAVLALVVGAWWLTRPERPSVSKPPAPVVVDQGTTPSPGAESEAVPVAATSPASPPSMQSSNSPAASVVPAALKASITTALQDEKNLYGYTGALNWDDAKALIAKRQQDTKAIEDRLAGLGAGGAKAIAAGYNETDDMHGKLMLIHALGSIQDPEADGVLQALLGSETSFSLQREIIAAMGQRQDAASLAMLSQIAADQADSKLRFAAVQSLSGQPDALPVLTQLIQKETNPDVEKEMILAVGAIHNDAAQGVLAGIAQGSMDVGIRETAIQELARVFGSGALSVFQQLLTDPNDAIRQNAVTAVAQVHTDGATALLQRTAASDSSEQVRTMAQAALSAAQAQ